MENFSGLRLDFIFELPVFKSLAYEFASNKRCDVHYSWHYVYTYMKACVGSDITGPFRHYKRYHLGLLLIRIVYFWNVEKGKTFIYQERLLMETDSFFFFFSLSNQSSYVYKFYWTRWNGKQTDVQRLCPCQMVCLGHYSLKLWFRLITTKTIKRFLNLLNVFKCDLKMTDKYVGV